MAGLTYYCAWCLRWALLTLLDVHNAYGEPCLPCGMCIMPTVSPAYLVGCAWCLRWALLTLWDVHDAYGEPCLPCGMCMMPTVSPAYLVGCAWCLQWALLTLWDVHDAYGEPCDDVSQEVPLEAVIAHDGQEGQVLTEKPTDARAGALTLPGLALCPGPNVPLRTLATLEALEYV